MRTATFQFSESGGSLNGSDLFTELPFLKKSLPNPSIASPLFTEKPFLFSLTSASSHPLPKTRLLIEELPSCHDIDCHAIREEKCIFGSVSTTLWGGHFYDKTGQKRTILAILNVGGKPV